jgi:endonuclease/exonuclease/phosphatase family metal-dependent hydrolase
MPRSALYSAVALLLSLAGCSSDVPVAEEEPPGPPEPFSVLAFNVLCSFCGGAEYDTWDERLVYFDDIFARHDPDLIGLQELSFAPEVDQMLELLPGYQALFHYREETNFAYPDATILYRAERFELSSRGEYWLSPTPEVPSSTGFAQPQLPRLVQWAELRDRLSRRSLYFASTHVDNNAPSQELSAPLILERTAPWQAEMPVVVLGDFNSQPADLAYQLLTEGAEGHPPLTNAQDGAASWGVDHNQPTEPAYDLDARIDHIFLAPDPGGWTVERWAADLYVYGPEDRYPSDHWPIFARLTAPPL